MIRVHQRGELGFQTFFLLIFTVLIVRAAVSLVPIYLERHNAVSLIEEALQESRLAEHSKRQMLENLNGKLTWAGIKHPSGVDFEVRREGRVYFLETDYTVSGKYMFDIELVVHFSPISIDVTDILSNR